MEIALAKSDRSELLVFLDSQVALAVAAKGRPSSWRLNRLLCRFNALCLAPPESPTFHVRAHGG